MQILLKKSILLFSVFVCLTANAQKIIRGPYLQSLSTQSVILRFDTDISMINKINFGESFNNQTLSLTDNNLAFQHIFKITNLKANTKYFYSIYLNSGQLVSDSTYYFITSPNVGDKQKISLTAWGDCGVGSTAQTNVYNQVQNYFQNKKLDGILLLGDNAYSYGKDAEYQSNFFNKYDGGRIRNTVIWPAPGNHDYGDRLVWPNDWGTLPDYYKIFSTPTLAESGGVASNSPSYYSVNYGNVHLVSLDSYASENSKRLSDPLSNQMTWLQKDLAANTQQWTIVFFHHPPYSKGSHNSDTESELVDIRKNLVPILEKYKVDLVLNGHSHTYERSYPIHDFYGNSEAFDLNLNASSSSSAKYDGSVNSCPYIKKNNEIVYVVAGTAGQTGGTSTGYPHHAMYYSDPVNQGALILEIESNRLDLKYLLESGTIGDNFTIFKEVNKTTNFNVGCGDKVSVSGSWICSNYCSSGVKPITTFTLDSLNKTSKYLIKDSYGCLRDTVNVTVQNYPNILASSNSPVLLGSNLALTATFSGLGTQSWLGPNAFTANTLNANIPKVTNYSAGIYTVSSVYKSCESHASVNVTVSQPLGNDLNENVKVHPNPFFEELILDWNVPKIGKYELCLMDILGKEVIKQVHEYQIEGKFLETLKMPYSLASGSYFLRISGEGYSQTIKLLK